MSIELKAPEEGLGAVVTIDHLKASPDVVHLIGMREFADRWIEALRHKAGMQKHEGVAQVMREIADLMAMDRDGISVALTRAALKDRSGAMDTFRKD